MTSPCVARSKMSPRQHQAAAMFTFGQRILHAFATLSSRGGVSSAGASDLPRVPTVRLTKGLRHLRAD